MKFNKNIILIGVIIIAILIISNPSDKKTGTISRSLSGTVNAGSQVTITLSGGSGFTGIIEQLPSGWTFVSGDNMQQVGNELRAYFTSSTYSYILTAPNYDTSSTFSGTFEQTGGISGTILGTNSINVITCTNECSPSGSKQCNGNIAQTCGNYDSDSCLEWGADQDCGTSSCGDWSLVSCSNLNIIQVRACVDRGCSGGQCTSNNRNEEKTIQTCTWRCDTGHCQRNTLADTNNDGDLTLSELVTYADMWISNQGPTLTQVINVADVWLVDGESPVNI